jgi:hypothetical protein
MFYVEEEVKFNEGPIFYSYVSQMNFLAFYNIGSEVRHFVETLIIAHKINMCPKAHLLNSPSTNEYISRNQAIVTGLRKNWIPIAS